MKCVVAVEDFSRDMWQELPQDVRFISKVLNVNIRKSRLLLMPFIIRGRTLGGLYVMNTNQEEDFDGLKAKLSSILVYIAAQLYDVITVKFSETWRNLVSFDREKVMSHILAREQSLSTSQQVISEVVSAKSVSSQQLSNKEQQCVTDSAHLIPSPKEEVSQQSGSHSTAREMQLNFLQKSDSLQDLPSASETIASRLQQIKKQSAPPQTCQSTKSSIQGEMQQIESRGMRKSKSASQVPQKSILQETTNLMMSSQMTSQQQSLDSNQQHKTPKIPNLRCAPLSKISSSQCQRPNQVGVQSDQGVYNQNNNLFDDQQKPKQCQVRNFLSRHPCTETFLSQPALDEDQYSRSDLRDTESATPLTSEFEVSVEFDIDDDMIKNGATIQADFPIDLIRQQIEHHKLNSRTLLGIDNTKQHLCWPSSQGIANTQKVFPNIRPDHVMSQKQFEVCQSGISLSTQRQGESLLDSTFS
eukprot:TRINITY_DN10054_c0_g1_i1.p1 TRINITY_DN10054_c0_g1~~TRINITY_DN10054_c0_g1_i1.p1  ORF type:complete len:553 (-),score=17.43 TRINITY_DN10054_c0_g1_i1:68-1480(-)